jgi:endonuclease G, mitochondrial
MSLQGLPCSLHKHTTWHTCGVVMLPITEKSVTLPLCYASLLHVFICGDYTCVNQNQDSRMKFVVVVLSLLISLLVTPTQAEPTSCAHVAPHGLPQLQLADSTTICRRGYMLQHDNQARIPAWVSYTLSRAQTLACAPRPDRFEPDPALRPHQRAHVSDYRRSGYDQGHMAPNADLSWDPQVQRESFYLSNIAPQLPGLNRGLWRELESIVRAWAHERGSLTIYVGPIYSRNSSRTIGVNRVVVPDAFFKVVIDAHSGAHMSFLFPHVNNLPDHVHEMRVPLAHVSHVTGIQFPLPPHARESVTTWRYNTRALHRDRSQTCVR